MPKEINPWAMYPRKTSTASLPESLKREVTTKANELIETVLKPKYIEKSIRDQAEHMIYNESTDYKIWPTQLRLLIDMKKDEEVHHEP